MRFIKLSAEEKTTLDQIYQKHIDHRVRRRARALLLSARGYKMDQLAGLFEVDRDTIGQWMDRWETKGIHGLSDAPRSGRPSILSEAIKKKYST